MLKDLWVVIESLRNSYDMLCDHLGAWIEAKLVFVDEPLFTDQSRQELWQSLGVEPETVELLTFTLRFEWRSGFLRVRSDCHELEDLVGQISFALLSMWKFRSFFKTAAG